MELDGKLVIADIDGSGPTKCLVRKCNERYYLLHNYAEKNGDCPSDGNRMGYSHSWSFRYQMAGGHFDCSSGVEILKILSYSGGVEVTWEKIKSNQL